MGEKQNRRGKRFYLFFACATIITVLLSGCAHFFYEDAITKADMEQAADLTSRGNYQEAVHKYEQIIARHPSLGDEVQFEMGLMYASPHNKYKDYSKALECFQQIIQNYPKSIHRRNSATLISLIEEIYKKDKKTMTQSRQIDKLEQEIEAMKKKLERIKKVDMELMQKKKTVP